MYDLESRNKLHEDKPDQPSAENDFLCLLKMRKVDHFGEKGRSQMKGRHMYCYSGLIKM